VSSSAAGKFVKLKCNLIIQKKSDMMSYNCGEHY
jgi:hypothetical protein